MNVFLPYPDYFKSIKVLDKKRCWKQVVEAKQLIDAILGEAAFLGVNIRPARCL
jgi:hypothetical protein